MKKIFDFMRRRVTENINTGRFGVGVFMDTVNKAEAKWESERCEWRHVRSYVNCFCKCNGIMVEHDLAIGFDFCPYCGKPIKIVEVD